MVEYTFSPGNSAFWTAEPDFHILKEKPRRRPYWLTETENRAADEREFSAINAALSRIAEKLDALERRAQVPAPLPPSPDLPSYGVWPTPLYPVIEQPPSTEEVSGIIIGIDEDDPQAENDAR